MDVLTDCCIVLRVNEPGLHVQAFTKLTKKLNTQSYIEFKQHVFVQIHLNVTEMSNFE